MYLRFLTKLKKAFTNLILYWCFLTSSISFSQTLQEGIFTEAQAARGAEEYAARCASCHSADLRGNSNSPSLVGLSFMFIWEDRNLGELFEKMSSEMPTENPGSLSQQSYAAILAFIIKSNGFPAGETVLASNAEALSSIQISSQ